MDSFHFGQTASGLPIVGYRFGHGPAHALVLGGVHGDEIEGVWGALGLLRELAKGPDLGLRVTLVPMLNLDGVLARERRNSRGVDLNRNLPTKDWTSEVATERYFPGTTAGSEPENQALTAFLSHHQIDFVLSLHSWKPMLNINGDCRPHAEAIAKQTGYIIEESIGYPTPGCLGTYAGLERAIPTLTYEIERGLDQAGILKTHVKAVIASLTVCAERKAKHS